MASGKGEVGRLWVSVSANTDQAVKKLTALDNRAKQTAQTLQRIGQGTTSSQSTRQLDATARAMDKTSKSSEKAKQGFDKVRKSSKQATVPVGQLQGAMYRLSQSFINLRYGNPIGVIAGLTQSVTQLGRAAAGSRAALGLMATGVGAIAVAAAAATAATLGLAYAFGKFGVKEAANLEMLKIQYEGLLGTAQAGAAEVDYILNLGKESVVPTEGLLEANRLLLAYGVTATETRRDLVKFFSDFGSATGLSAARLQDMAYALGQVEAQGKANQIDMRQLANAGLNLTTVYEKIAEQQKISAQEAKELTSEGKLTADILIPAVVALGDNYEDAAAKARDSVRGILANLKDIVKINIGTAFEGLLEKLKPLLKWAEAFLESFDFRPIAMAIGNFVDYIKEALGSLNADAVKSAEAISKTVAALINSLGYLFGRFVSYVSALVATYELGVNAVVTFASAALQTFLDLATTVFDVVEKIPGSIGESIAGASAEIKAFSADVDNFAQGAQDSLTDAAVKSAEAWANFGKGFTDFKGITPQTSAFDPSMLGGGLTPDVKPAPTIGSGGGSGGNKYTNKKLADEIKDLQDAIQSFRNMTATPLGSQSDISQALGFGTSFEDGKFQGNADSIVQSFTKVRAAVVDYYDAISKNADAGSRKMLLADRKDTVKNLEKQYQEMYDLAKKNENLQTELERLQEENIAEFSAQLDSLEVEYDKSVKAASDYWTAQIRGAEAALEQATQAYDDANSKLQALIAARDSYLSNITQSAFNFVNALTETNEAISQVTNLDDVGSFSAVSGEGTADFKAQLQSRLDAVKQWRSDIETLMARGVDRNLMDALIAGGPEGSGALATALANETDAGIAEINNIQAELTSTVAGLNQSVSAQFFDAGIAQQQAYTAAMQADVFRAQQYLEAQRAQRDEALRVLEEDYNTRKSMLDANIKEVKAANDAQSVAIKKQMENNAVAANAMADQMTATVAKLGSRKKTDKQDSLYHLGKEAIDGLIVGMNSQKGKAVAVARSIANAIKAEMKGAFQIASPSKVMMAYGEDIAAGLAIGMEQGVARVDMASARLTAAAMPGGQAAPTVKVFIGDQELRDMVDVQISDASGRDLDTVYAGRRDF